MLTAIAVQVLLVVQTLCLDPPCTPSGKDPGCDDGNPCTTDTWDGYDCVYAPRTGAACDDGNPCTTNDVCTSAGTCAGTIAVGLACSDSNVCTTNDTCGASGACVGGPLPTLSDQTASTYDYCDGGGVHHDAIAGGGGTPATGQAGAAPVVAPNPRAQPLPAMPTQGGPHVVENTGEVRYQYGFGLPAARSRYQPALGLTYSSASSLDEDYGHGWSLSMSYIEIDPSVLPSATDASVAGSPKVRFRLWSGADQVLLVWTWVDGSWRPEAQSGFLRITATAAGTGWSAVDSAGNTFLYETFFGGGGGIGGRWYLTSVTDVDGNKTVFSYQREWGAPAVLTNVSYNNYVDSTGVERFATVIDLAYAAAPEIGPRRAPRIARAPSEMALHLTAVSVQARSPATGALTLLRRYDMGYRFSLSGAQVLLTSIAVGAGDGAAARSLPPTTFEYEVPGEALFTLSDVDNYLGMPEPGMWIDLNGDGLADRVQWGTSGLVWARNLTVPGSTTLAFAPVAPLAGGEGTSLRPLFDMNGDGLPDLVRTTTGWACPSSDPNVQWIEVRFAQLAPDGTPSYGTPVCWNVSATLPRMGTFSLSPGWSDLFDANGDGVADLRVKISSIPFDSYVWFLGDLTTSGWAFGAEAAYWVNWSPLPLLWTHTPVPAPWVGQYSCSPPYELFSFDDPRQVGAYADLNGDGVVDYVERLSDPDGTCTLQPCRFLVWWGTGNVYAQGADFVPRPPPGAVCPPDFAFPAAEARKATVMCNYTDLNNVDHYTTGLATFVGWEAGFIDLNGDGVADYVSARSPSAACDSSNGGAWSAHVGRLASTLLRNVTTSAGAAYAVTYEKASVFGAGPRDGLQYVATSIAITGPRVPSATSYYWYQGPSHASLWYAPLQDEPRGFSTTWVYDGAAALVRTTTWATTSHVFKGSPLSVEWGTPSSPFGGSYDPSQPPAATRFRWATLSYATRNSYSSASCSNGVAEPAAGAYPVIPVVTSAVSTSQVGGVQLTSSRSIACADVDAYGNVLRTSIDPDVAFAGDEYYQSTSYDAGATCKSCPVVSEVHSSTGALLAQSYYRYDSPPGTWNPALPQGSAGSGHLNYVSRWVGASTYEIASATAYNSNGSVAWRVIDPQVASHSYPVTESYTYDLQGLRVTRKTVSDSSGALMTDTTYDDAGRPVLEVGPYVSGSGGAQVAYAYDVFGRVIAVGRSISAGTVTNAIAAVEYVDAQPPAVKRYQFLGSGIQFAVGQVPAISDVKQVVTHFDGLGRSVEVRERLGGGPISYSSSQLTQLLSGYRVTQSVKYDAAGRVVASLEPVYSTTGTDAYEGFDVLTQASGRRGSVSSFDAQGRLTCAKSGAYAALAAGGCSSSFGDDANHVLATAFSYLGATEGGRNVIVATAVPPTDNSLLGGTRAYYRADGRLASTADAYDSTTSYVYDTLGRPLSVTRQAAGVAKSAQTVTKTYDSVGRVVEEWDDNWSPGASPSRRYHYDAAGRVTFVQLPPQLFGTVRAELRYEYKSLGRRTRAYALEPSWVSGAVTLTTREIAGYTYDKPYLGSTAYAFTAGRLSYLTSPLTTIAFGYDQYGLVQRRDQWFLGLSGAFSVTGDLTPDGRVRWSSFGSGYSQAVTWTGGYDTAARPVRIAIGATALWEAVSQSANTGGYDALDRIPLVRSNGGIVNTARSYSTNSGQLTAHGVATTAAQVYQTNALLYLGTKLGSYQDGLTATSYAYTYDGNGRLAAATASTTSASPLAQSYANSYSFTDSSWPAGATVGNLEQVTAASQTVDYDYLADRVVSRSTAPAGPLIEVMVYDHQGRLTSRRDPSGTTETEGFAYDVEDQLKQVRRSGAVAEVLEYDPLGAVMFRKVGTKAYWYVGSFATVTADVSTSCLGYGCSPTTTPKVGLHVLLAGTRIATVRAPPSGSTADPAGDVLYYHRDQRGSVIATTLSGGRVGVKYRYGPYGELDRQEVVDGTGESELGFTGGLRLGWTPGSQSGSLLLLGARVYHAELRRWVQADTVEASRYTYAAGEPVNAIDPTGRETVQIFIGGVEVNSEIAYFYMRTMYPDQMPSGSWNLYIGGLIYDARVDYSIRYKAASEAYRNAKATAIMGQRLTGALGDFRLNLDLSFMSGPRLDASSEANGFADLERQTLLGPTWPSGRLDSIITHPYHLAGEIGCTIPSHLAWGHRAIDIRNRLGDPVFSAYAGQVERVESTSSGNVVVVRNFDDSLSGYVHVTATVQVGDTLWAGSWLGRTDLSGNVQGAHLHYYWIPAGSTLRADPTLLIGLLAPGGQYPQ